MQPGQLTDPVVRVDRTRPARLLDADRRNASAARDVDGLAELRGEPFAAQPAVLGDVQTTGYRTGQTQHAKAQTVLAAVLSLLNQFAILQGSE
jgi:hypothetical protein